MMDDDNNDLRSSSKKRTTTTLRKKDTDDGGVIGVGVGIVDASHGDDKQASTKTKKQVLKGHNFDRAQDVDDARHVVAADIGSGGTKVFASRLSVDDNSVRSNCLPSTQTSIRPTSGAPSSSSSSSKPSMLSRRHDTHAPPGALPVGGRAFREEDESAGSSSQVLGVGSGSSPLPSATTTGGRSDENNNTIVSARLVDEDEEMRRMEEIIERRQMQQAQTAHVEPIQMAKETSIISGVAVGDNVVNQGETNEQRKRRYLLIFGGILIIVLVVIIVASLVIVLLAANDDDDEIPGQCFTSGLELRTIIDEYVADGGDVGIMEKYGNDDGSIDKEAYEITSKYGYPMNTWCVSHVVDFATMFDIERSNTTALLFNDDISDWDVSSATTMESMFRGTRLFDRDISSWDVSNVVTMKNMFREAQAFNYDVSQWDVRNAGNVNWMFCFTGQFQQDLCDWGSKLPINAIVANMFTNSTCTYTESPVLNDTSVTPGPFCMSDCN